MYYPIIKSITLTAALLLSASPGLAANPQAQPSHPAVAASAAMTTEVGDAAKKPATPTKPKPARLAAVKPVNINSASKTELMKLPGIGATEADKIIAARPYLTKTRLVTKNIISMSVYQDIRPLVIARQKETPTAR